MQHSWVFDCIFIWCAVILHKLTDLRHVMVDVKYASVMLSFPFCLLQIDARLPFYTRLFNLKSLQDLDDTLLSKFDLKQF